MAFPHDSLFRAIFSVPEHCWAELRAILPPALTVAIDPGSLKLRPDSFVDVTLKRSQADLLFEATLRDSPCYLYLLFEHLSAADRLTPVRLFAYVAHVWEAHLKRHASAGTNPLPLPPVIPIVLHHSRRGWTAARSLEALFPPELSCSPEVDSLLPHFPFILDDISHASDEALRRRAEGSAALAVPVALWALRDSRDEERLVASLHAWVGALVTLATSPTGADALCSIMHYICAVGRKLSTVQTILDTVSAAAPETTEAMASIAQQLEQRGREKALREGLQQGLQEGLQQGLQEGLQQGRLLSTRANLHRLLERKFGALPGEWLERLDGADEPTLLQWFEQAIFATSLDELRL